MAEKTPELSDVFRVTRDGSEVKMSFGVYTGAADELSASVPSNCVRELTSARFDVGLLKVMVTRLMQQGIKYQLETGDDLGFPVPERLKEKFEAKKKEKEARQ